MRPLSSPGVQEQLQAMTSKAAALGKQKAALQQK